MFKNVSIVSLLLLSLISCSESDDEFSDDFTVELQIEDDAGETVVVCSNYADVFASNGSFCSGQFIDCDNESVYEVECTINDADYLDCDCIVDDVTILSLSIEKNCGAMDMNEYLATCTW